MLKPFSLDIEPTFTKRVPIPVPGKKPHEVEFTFKHRNQEALRAFLEGLPQMESDTDAVMEVACGWELQDAWERDNVHKLVTNYLGAAKAILDVYIHENSGARLGN